MANEKLSAPFTNSKSTQLETKENKRVKHHNAEKGKKRKEERVFERGKKRYGKEERAWDIVVMVMNEKANLEVVEFFENSVKSVTCS